SHYKLTWAKDGSAAYHSEMSNYNTQQAVELVTQIHEASASERTNVTDRAFVALRASLDILRARKAYHDGSFDDALSIYDSVTVDSDFISKIQTGIDRHDDNVFHE